VHYTIDNLGFAFRKKVASILPSDPDTCTQFDEFCLNQATRHDLGYTFFQQAFSRQITIPTQLGTRGGLFPDPADTTITDKDFTTVISNIMGTLILITSLEYGEEIREQILWEDQSCKFIN
jgi:hypothetical protein